MTDQGGNYFPYLVPSNGNDTCSVPIDDNRPRETSHLCTTSSFSKHLEVSNSSGDYDHDSNSLNYDFMFDVPEKYMILPLLERTKGEDLVKEDVHHSLSLNYCQSVYQMDGLEEDTFEFPHIKGSTPLDMQLSTENFHDLSEVSSMWAMFFPKETRRRKTVTLVLDLDGKLAHSLFNGSFAKSSCSHNASNYKSCMTFKHNFMGNQGASSSSSAKASSLSLSSRPPSSPL